MKTKTVASGLSKAGNVAGVASNHSSVEPSADTSIPGHAQFDDELDDVAYMIDPNMSGTNETAPLHDPIAGQMSEWEENDDYRHFLQTGTCAESRLWGEYEEDMDFDDNGGIPTPIPAYSGGGEPGEIPTKLSPVIIRRF